MTNAVLQFVAATDNIAITEYPNHLLLLWQIT